MKAFDRFYEELIAFAREYHIMILHENAYSDIIYGGRRGKSFLCFEGAKFVMDLMEKAGAVCVPGSNFGSLGEGFVDWHWQSLENA